MSAQIGRNGNPFGRQRTAIPQAQTPQKEPEPKTAEELVEEQMPQITETLELDAFEQAVVRSTFTKYVQKRMELQILQLEPQKMKEEFQKLQQQQDEEMKAGLPEEKYQTYLDLMKNPSKAKKAKRKKKKKNKKSEG
ncbi:hypothetical protein [Allomuricauda sp. d1]|uniref:hypothetical protein n=1 Tax=Allomuricauda sp. d1 TaxID=3136725 RepID=UPI0031D864F8